jgi:hypothetical protein
MHPSQSQWNIKSLGWVKMLIIAGATVFIGYDLFIVVLAAFDPVAELEKKERKYLKSMDDLDQEHLHRLILIIHNVLSPSVEPIILISTTDGYINFKRFIHFHSALGHIFPAYVI